MSKIERQMVEESKSERSITVWKGRLCGPSMLRIEGRSSAAELKEAKDKHPSKQTSHLTDEQWKYIREALDRQTIQYKIELANRLLEMVTGIWISDDINAALLALPDGAGVYAVHAGDGELVHCMGIIHRRMDGDGSVYIEWGDAK